MRQAILIFGLLLIALSGRAQAPEGAVAVDLGLPSGTKWATMNVGATAPGYLGFRVAFYELEPKSEYTEYTSLYYHPYGAHNYSVRTGDMSGTKYDVAHVRWGGKWRIPTKEEFEELIKYCTRSSATVDGNNGCWFVGPNGNQVFLPYSPVINYDTPGYWSSTPHQFFDSYGGVHYYEDRSHYFGWAKGMMWTGTLDDNLRDWYKGSYVRPVMSEDKTVEEVSIVEIDEDKGIELESQGGIYKITKTYRHGWNTLVLPFGISSGSRQLSQLFGNQNYRTYTFEGFENGVLKFKANTTGILNAHTPYLLFYEGNTNKTTRYITPHGLSSVYPISPGTPSKASGDFEFSGTYSVLGQGNDVISENDYVIGKRTFDRADGGNELKAFCAYMKNRNPSEIDSSFICFSLDGVTVDTRIVLDENSTKYPEPTEGDDDIRVKRTIVAGEWNTIALPFSMTEEQVKSVFGDDVMLKEFVKYETNENITTITVVFKDADIAGEGLKANVPYIIRTSKDVSEFLIRATIQPGGAFADYHYDNPETGEFRFGYFVGTYVAETLPENTLFLNNNCFWYSTGNTVIKGYRAFFDFKDVLSSKEGANTRVGFSFGETTKVKGVLESLRKDNITYDLLGRKVEKLRKGIYIRDGKKIVISND